jgi:hypothetical protein
LVEIRRNPIGGNNEIRDWWNEIEGFYYKISEKIQGMKLVYS